MPYGSPQFTPRQLLDAGRHAEAEGKLDVAYQFYRHLTDHYGTTAEAAEGRSGLARLGGVPGPYPPIWQASQGASVPPAVNGNVAPRNPQRGRHQAFRRDSYRAGRTLARLVEGIGWLLIVGGLLWLMAVLAAEFNLTVLLHPLQLNYAAVVQIAGALLCGAVTVLWGQAARALFDQASATRELVAIERTRDGAEHF